MDRIEFKNIELKLCSNISEKIEESNLKPYVMCNYTGDTTRGDFVIFFLSGATVAQKIKALEIADEEYNKYISQTRDGVL